MVLVVGDGASDQRDREAFQEMDYRVMFGPSALGMAKRVERIDDAARIPEYVARAFATAMNGRPGPVVLVLPEDMLTQTLVANASGKLPRPLPRVEPVEAWSDPGALRRLRELLLKSERPFVIAGGGGWTPQAAQALQRFAENWRLPVASATTGWVNMSSGSTSTTGPGRPFMAVAKARAMYSGIRAASSMRSTRLAMPKALGPNMTR